MQIRNTNRGVRRHSLGTFTFTVQQSYGQPIRKHSLGGGKKKSRQAIKGSKRTMSPEMVKEVVQLFGQGTNLLHHRTVVICLLGFSGFLRISELLDIQIKHLTFLSSHLEIFIPKAKTTSLRQGHIVHIKRLNSQFCPVQWLQAYLDRSGLITGENNYIISRLAKSRSGHRAYGYKPLAESTVRDTFNKDIFVWRHPTRRLQPSFHAFGRGLSSNQSRGKRETNREAREMEVGILQR